ncbi:hypothetical protein B7708_03060 [Streptococcus oralis subsp. dentisani]|uniref:Uncharacterized protein n=1 Tax=Streptococcus oralis subsp. dentisani TaxID=1458253 RepID=A0A1X1J8K0_STROR|nr:hypothetical protein B7708_03060 [Streptococcus oralis subsp. dentisani]ORO81633.1 hypothetical protein B7706_08015 [Streptococcus oralis subsp. dentisani]ORO82088.1 hypothetical protein B7704_06645 [Streptococcus oralis subsp. dentisani]
MHRKTVIDFRALGERYTFTQPIKELKTRDLSEVADLLAQVESYQEQVTDTVETLDERDFNQHNGV